MLTIISFTNQCVANCINYYNSLSWWGRVRVKGEFTLTQTLSLRGRGYYNKRLVKRAGANASQYAFIAARLPGVAYPPAVLYHMDMELIYL
jgi:hypothetical protein